MTKHTLYVGLDTDKRHIDVAVAEPLPGGEVRYWGQIGNEPAALDRVIRRLQKGGRELEVCYEAGPCGFGIYRRLNHKRGVRCHVVAPSMTPRRPGSRVKTNRRDSLTLVKLLRAEELTAAWVPDVEHEAMRDLTRARSATMQDLTRCRQRITGFLLRQEIVYVGKPWTKKYRTWLGRLEFAAPAHRLMFDELLSAFDATRARCDRLLADIVELLPTWSLCWLVTALQALRGYRLINAVTLVAEIGDPRRFENPRQLMAYVGMVPSEHSTGDSVRRGGITKTGNRGVRKVLIEATWTYARRAKSLSRAEGQPEEVRIIAEKALHRLSSRYRRLMAQGKLAQVAITAVARESLGFIWAIAHAAGAAKETASGVSGARPSSLGGRSWPGGKPSQGGPLAPAVGG